MRNFRRIADDIYEKFPFFHIQRREFFSKCLPLQRCGAGIILGYPMDEFEARIVEVSAKKNSAAKYANLPLGHFGEIVFRRKDELPFVHTGMYGFFDQRGRIWCCGKIDSTVLLNGRKYFPYCIEPLFEHLWWVKRAKFGTALDKSGGTKLQLTVYARMGIGLFVNLFKKHFAKKLSEFAKKFRITSELDKFSIKTSGCH
jgi:hypothetical protein